MMTYGRITAVAVTLVLVVAVQLSVLTRLPGPGTPDLVLVVVVALAVAKGVRVGVISGFSAGLLLDVLPPADHALGHWAFVLCLIGGIAAVAAHELQDVPFAPLLVLGSAALLAPVLFALLGALVGDPRSQLVATLKVLPAELVYALLLGPFVVPLVGRLVRERRNEVFR